LSDSTPSVLLPIREPTRTSFSDERGGVEMLKAFQNRMKDDKGFTLIELMVVVLIIAILIAIAIPTFLGLRKRAQDRAAQSNLRNGLTAAKAFYTDGDTFVGFDSDLDGSVAAAEGAGDIEPSLTWNDAVASVEGEVSIREIGVGGDTVLLTTLSASGEFFCIGDDAGQNVSGNVEAAAIADCTGGF
jgi:type IV pilus assembly protein PilA